MLKSAMIALLALSLAACISPTTISLANKTRETSVDQIKLLLGNRPPCDYIVLAWFNIPGDYFSRESMIKSLKTAAALEGADYLQIDTMQKITVLEYSATARALRCIPVHQMNSRQMDI